MAENCTPNDEKISGSIALATMAFTAMGLLCCVEMYALIAVTFRRYSGLYFWSLIGTTTSQTFVCWSVLLSFWILKDKPATVTLPLSALGYLGYVPFENLILYSRLHLLSASKRSLHFVLAIIMAEWALVEVPTVVFQILTTVYPDWAEMAKMYMVWWQVEAAAYLTLNFVLYGMYFVHVKKMWGEVGRMQNILWNVIYMNAILISIDITYLVLSYTAEDNLVIGIEAFLFALKLKFEIYTLNMLSDMSQRHLNRTHEVFGQSDMLSGCSGTDTNNKDNKLVEIQLSPLRTANSIR